MKYKNILFDLDGTLLDFFEAQKICLKRMFESFGLEFNDAVLWYYEKVNNFLWREYDRGKIEKDELRFLRFYVLNDAFCIKKNVFDMNVAYMQNLESVHIPMSGVGEILKALDKKGIVSLIVTNGRGRTARDKLAMTGLDCYFKRVYASDEVGYHKPQKEFFDIVMKEEKLAKNDCLIVGDGLSSDIAGGICYGIDTAWFNSSGKPNFTELKPTYEILRLSELLDII